MIQKVEILNFRCHENTIIEFSTINSFVGPSGSGKTSVLDAITTMLVGRNKFTDARGSGLREDIRVGTSGMTVICQFGDGRLYARTVQIFRSTSSWPKGCSCATLG
jgi:DNA repair exonuclease SbcCD ATPase subunit